MAQPMPLHNVVTRTTFVSFFAFQLRLRCNPFILIMLVEFSPSDTRNDIHAEKLISDHRPANFPPAGKLSDRFNSLLKSRATQKAQLVHLGFGQQHFSCNTVAVALKLSAYAPITHSGCPEPQVRQFVEHCERPCHRGILIINDNKRRQRISNGVSSENTTGNICVIAAQISEQQHEYT